MASFAQESTYYYQYIGNGLCRLIARRAFPSCVVNRELLYAIAQWRCNLWRSKADTLLSVRETVHRGWNYCTCWPPFKSAPESTGGGGSLSDTHRRVRDAMRTAGSSGGAECRRPWPHFFWSALMYIRWMSDEPQSSSMISRSPLDGSHAPCRSGSRCNSQDPVDQCGASCSRVGGP